MEDAHTLLLTVSTSSKPPLKSYAALVFDNINTEGESFFNGSLDHHYSHTSADFQT